MRPRAGDFGVQPFDLAAWRRNRSNRVQAAICVGTLSRYWHACVIVAVAAGPGVPALAPRRVEIVEAAQGGARTRWVNEDEFVWSRCDLTDEQRGRIVAEALACLGLPYDWRDIARFLLRFFGSTIRGRSGDHPDDRLICSELVAWCYRQAGHEAAPSADIAPGDVSPGDLADHITRGEPA